jgi:protein translocase SecG subunit
MVLTILQIVVAALLIASILLQAQGTGLSTAFGGGGEVFRSKRNAEKFLVILTIFLAAVLAILSLILLGPHI